MATAIHIGKTKKSFGGEDIFVIAEIGKNFIQTEEERSVAEYLNNAKELVAAAKEAGADAVKFQTHDHEDEQLNLQVTSPHFKGSDRYNWIQRNVRAAPLDTFWRPLKAYCDEQGILFFSTPMSRNAARKLETVNVPFWKIGSGDVQDYAMIDFMAQTRKPIIISSGMVSLSELDEVIQHVRSKNIPLIVLYCISQYPAPPEYFNLGTIEYLIEKYPDVVIGFSDHSLGHGVALAAAKLGACVIEKHFSFSRDLWGSDHKASMTPDEMRDMIRDLRGKKHHGVDPTTYYGVKEKELEGANNIFRPYFNKSLMAGIDLPRGTVIDRDMIYAMRPRMYAKGLPAEQFEKVVGKTLRFDLKKYDPITWEVLA